MARLSSELAESFVRTLLTPVVRFCLRRSVSYSSLSRLVKQLFLELGEEHIRSSGESPSVSRLSALTGLDRRDITRFLKEGNFFTRKENLLARVVGMWEQHPSFSRGPGKAKPLSSEGIGSEFFALVQSVSKDLNPYTVLNELERTGALQRDGNTAKLIDAVYVPRDNFEDGLRILGKDSQDLLAAVESNLVHPNKPRHLHIRTHYNNLSPKALQTIQEWFLIEGEKLHRKVRRYLAKFDKDLNPKITEGGGRATFGSFSFVEKDE